MDTLYEQRLKNEIAHYEKEFKDRLSQKGPMIWKKIIEHLLDRIEKKTGFRGSAKYIKHHFKDKKEIHILSLGAGPGGYEFIQFLPELDIDYDRIKLTFIDINSTVVDTAKKEAHRIGIELNYMIQDINALSLPPENFDVIIAHSSLHHFIELDHITAEINKGLKKDGLFVTTDIPTRNGYKMWDETYEIVNEIWRYIPERYKIDHTGFDKPTLMSTYPNIDYSENSFECINSEAILPCLRKNLIEIEYVPALCISRRFFDTKFGPNFDVNDAFDTAFFDFIINLDIYYLDNNILKPETFFGIYKKK